MMEDSFEYIQPHISHNDQFLHKSSSMASAVKPIRKQNDDGKVLRSNSMFYVNQDGFNNNNNNSSSKNKLWQKEMNLISLENMSHNKDLVTYQYINKVSFKFFHSKIGVVNILVI